VCCLVYVCWPFLVLPAVQQDPSFLSALLLTCITPAAGTSATYSVCSITRDCGLQCHICPPAHLWGRLYVLMPPVLLCTRALIPFKLKDA
jgi:hypothetical protein